MHDIYFELVWRQKKPLSARQVDQNKSKNATELNVAISSTSMAHISGDEGREPSSTPSNVVRFSVPKAKTTGN